MENTLFTKAAFDDLKMEVKKVEKIVVETTIIIIDGNSYELEDLYETCETVAGGGAYVTDPTMGDMLVKYGVLGSAGSPWSGGCKGPNYEAFMKMLQEKF